MEIIEADNSQDVERASALIRGVAKAHGVLLYPTDTVNGLGCSIYDAKAVDKLISIKKRSPQKVRLPALVSGIGAAQAIAVVDADARRLMEAFWPGALTIVMPLRDSRIDRRVCAGGALSLRMPKSDVARSIAGIFAGAVVGTSANISGEKPIDGLDEIRNKMGALDLAVLSSSRKSGRPSTVFDMQSRQIVREGDVTKSDIDEVLG
jgi:L-threonylcarbamoyladenylate synthase